VCGQKQRKKEEELSANGARGRGPARVAPLRSLQRAPRAGPGLAHALRRAGGFGRGPPNRWQERPGGGPHGLSVQPRGRRHQNPQAHHSPHEIRPPMRVPFLPPRLRHRPFSLSPQISLPNSSFYRS